MDSNYTASTAITSQRLSTFLLTSLVRTESDFFFFLEGVCVWGVEGELYSDLDFNRNELGGEDCQH